MRTSIQSSADLAPAPATARPFEVSQKTKDLITLCRPHHLVKNGLVLLPFALSGFAGNAGPVLVAFICFSLMAMAVYALNDMLDAFYDMSHPTKCHRPVASGRVSEREVFALTVCLFLSSLVLSFVALGFEPTLLLFVYFVLNVFYSQFAKDLAIVDVVIVASGFVLRFMVGLSVTGTTEAFGWIMAPLFCAALCMAVGKRLAKLLRATDRSTTRISAFYTTKSTTWLAILTSNVAIIVLSILTLHNWDQLIIQMGFSPMGLVAIGLATLFIWTRVLSGMLGNREEPTDIFTRDRMTGVLVLVLVGVIGLDVSL